MVYCNFIKSATTILEKEYKTIPI